MAYATPAWTAFNAGELSPLLDGRTDQDKYFNGAKRMVNFIPTVQGPATRRGGSRYLGATKNNSRVWLLPFEFSTEQSYVLEFGAQYVRFWANRGQLLSGPSPYEIASPWTAANLTNSEGACALRITQSQDVMWIAHSTGAVPPYKLQRLSATNWTLTPAPFDAGPFQDVNPLNTVVLTPSATTGTITITAASATFGAQHVGTSIYFEPDNPSLVAPWRPGVAFALNALVRYEGSVYKCTLAATSGNTPPTHLFGSSNDGACTWEYLHSQRGWAKITAVGSATSATATVTSYIPDACVSGTKRWALAEFDSVRGWPTDVCFFRDRLVWVRGRQLCMSFAGDYDNHERYDGPDVTKETAIKLTVANDRVENLRWCLSGRDLLVGSARSELAVREQTTQQVFAADNAVAFPQTEYGCRSIKPIRAGQGILFIQRGGRRLRELVYSFEIDRYKAEDMNVLAPHILEAGAVDLDYALEPHANLWVVLADGTLAALTYNRDRGVVAWAPHIIGGPGAFVETCASIPQPDNRRDDVWLVVRRTINGQTVRYVEVIEDERLGDTDVKECFFVDGGITYRGAAAATITGLSHLEGATVQVLVNGTPHADCVVSGGQIVLNRSGTVVHVGFNSAAILQTMRAEVPTEGGTAQTKRKTIARVGLRLYRTLGGRVGPTEDRADPIKYLDPGNPVGVAPSLFTGDKIVSIPAETGTDGYVTVVQDQPLPITVQSIVLRMQVNG
ncbi:MAG: hypothetical protein INH13_25670 [Cupriavidus sp.]|nr:hypothetical protein [Cupriavidus sp.]MCA3701414.1 hypothetical protein [Methylobacterium sp.]